MIRNIMGSNAKTKTLNLRSSRVTTMYMFNGRQVPHSVTRYGKELSIIKTKGISPRNDNWLRNYIPYLKRKSALVLAADMYNRLPETPPLISKTDNPISRKHAKFIRCLPNEELEYLMLHYHDKWLWETDSPEDKESFELLLEERDRRKENEWIVEKISKEDAKRDSNVFLNEKVRVELVLSWEINNKPKIVPGPSIHLDLIVDIFKRFGITRESSLIKYIDGMLRRQPW